MNVVCTDLNGYKVAEMQSKGIIIRSARDAADIIGQLLERGVRKLILHQDNLCPEMWEVSNGLAEAILKNFSDSAVEVAIVGDFDQNRSKDLRAFIEKTNLGNQTMFVGNVELARMRLSKQ